MIPNPAMLSADKLRDIETAFHGGPLPCSISVCGATAYSFVERLEIRRRHGSEHTDVCLTVHLVVVEKR